MPGVVGQFAQSLVDSFVRKLGADAEAPAVELTQAAILSTTSMVVEYVRKFSKARKISFTREQEQLFEELAENILMQQHWETLGRGRDPHKDEPGALAGITHALNEPPDPDMVEFLRRAVQRRRDDAFGQVQAEYVNLGVSVVSMHKDEVLMRTRFLTIGGKYAEATGCGLTLQASFDALHAKLAKEEEEP